MNRKQKLCIILAFSLCLSAVGGTGATAAAKKTSIKLNKKKQSIYIGQKKKIKAVIQNGKKGMLIVWKSLNPKVASVTAKGVVKGKKAGKAKIRAKIKGKKITATCTVTVKKKVSPTKPSESTASPDVTQSPEASTSPDDTLPPETSASPDASTSPDGSTFPDTTASPGATTTPPDTTEKPDVQPSGPLLAVEQSETETVYLLDRDYEGTVHISFGGETFTVSGKVKEALSLLATTYITRTNSAGTIRVSRVYPSEYWELTNLRSGETYRMWVESRYSHSLYENCGAIRFQGDVMAVIQVY